MTTARATIEQDVPCMQCGYNLRGLTPPGKCPECAFDLTVSLWRHRQKQTAHGPVDPLWARQMTEGAILCLLVPLFMLAMALAPEAAYTFHTPRRVALLCISATWWVLAWYSQWKLASIEPNSFESRDFRWTLRATATAYMLVPFIWAGSWPEVSGLLELAAIIACCLAGLVASCLVYVRMRSIGNRLSGRALPVLATLLAMCSPLVFFLGLVPASHLRGGVSSLDMMLEAPLCQYGRPGLLRDFAEALRYGRVQLFDLLYIFWMLVAVVTAVYLLVALRRAQKFSAHGGTGHG